MLSCVRIDLFWSALRGSRHSCCGVDSQGRFDAVDHSSCGSLPLQHVCSFVHVMYSCRVLPELLCSRCVRQRFLSCVCGGFVSVPLCRLCILCICGFDCRRCHEEKRASGYLVDYPAGGFSAVFARSLRCYPGISRCIRFRADVRVGERGAGADAVFVDTSGCGPRIRVFAVGTEGRCSVSSGRALRRSGRRRRTCRLGRRTGFFGSASVAGLLYAGSECFEVLMWFSLASIGARNLSGALVVIAWGRAASSAGLLMGAFVGHMMNASGNPSLVSAGLVFMLVVFVAVNVSVLKEFSFQETIDGIAPLENVGSKQGNAPLDVMRGCDLLIKEKALTPRESEIIKLLARGRNAPYIQEKLVLSRNTVKTHVANIYAKVGVHSQQDLIDIVEAHARKSVDEHV